jgi:hypothetical protein
MKSSCTFFILNFNIYESQAREIKNRNNPVVTLSGTVVDSLFALGSLVIVCVELVDKNVNYSSVSCCCSKVNCLRP